MRVFLPKFIKNVAAGAKKGSTLVGSCMRARVSSTHLIFLCIPHLASIVCDLSVLILLMLAMPEKAVYAACGIATVAISFAL